MSDRPTIDEIQPFKSWLRGLVGADTSSLEDPVWSVAEWAKEIDELNWWSPIADGHFRLIDVIREIPFDKENFIFAWDAWASTLGKLQCCNTNCSNSFLAHSAQLRYCSRQCAPNDHFLWRAYKVPANDVTTLDARGKETDQNTPKTIDSEARTFRGWLLLIRKAERLDYIYKRQGSSQYLSDFTSHVAYDVTPGDEYPACGAKSLLDIFAQPPVCFKEAVKAALVFAWCEYAEFVEATECAAHDCSRPIVTGSKQLKYCSDKCRKTHQREATREYHRQKRREELNGALKRIIKQANSLTA